MSRIDRKIGVESDSPVDATEILAALARETGTSAKSRQDAVSRYLSASEGWREASAALGGAFAAAEPELKAGEE